MGNTLDSLQEAAILLSQNGPIKERLAQAYLRHLASIEPAQLPDAFHGDFRDLCEAMSRERPLPRENPVRASVRKMSTEEASRHAALVVRLYAAVARSGGMGSPLPRTPVLAPVLQLFAAEG